MPPFQIDDSVPTEEEVDWAVRILQGHRSGGPSQMRAKHLHEWLQEQRAAEAAAEAESEVETLGTEWREIDTE